MIHVLALIGYILAFVLWLRLLIGQEGRSWAPVLVGIGVSAHLLALVRFTVHWGELPLQGLGPSLSTLAFLIGLGLLATLALGEAGRVGILLVPLMVLLEGSALAVGLEPGTRALDFRGAWFALHVTLALAGIGAVAVSAAAGSLYLVQFRQIRQRHLGKLFHFMPPLTVLQRVVGVGITAAFTMLTVAVLLGWAWTYSFLGSLRFGDSKVMWAVFTWAVTAAAMVAVRRGDERTGARALLLSFGLIVGSWLAARGLSAGGGFFP